MAGNKNSKNETSFKKGNNANPKGAPVKEMRITTWIEKELDASLENPHASVLGYEAEISRRQAVAKRLVNMALDSKDNQLALQAIKEIADRTEGKPHQTTDVTSDGEKIANVVFMKPEKMQDEE